MKQNYITRAIKARDPRFAKIVGKLGYGTRAMEALPVEAAPTPDALDHDEDGRKGGSKAGEASTRKRGSTKAQLAAEYEHVAGAKPDGRWSKTRLEQELDKARGGK